MTEQTIHVTAEAAAHLHGNLALLIIDAQRFFCDPAAGYAGSRETDAKCRAIGSILPHFRKAGVPVYSIYYFSDEFKHCRDNPRDFRFYQFMPSKKDTLVQKTDSNAFSSSNLDAILKKDGRKSLLVCGFYTSACVSGTVYSARRLGYDVTLLDDLTEDSQGSRQRSLSLDGFRKAGIEITQSADALNKLNSLKNQALAPY